MVGLRGSCWSFSTSSFSLISNSQCCAQEHGSVERVPRLVFVDNGKILWPHVRAGRRQECDSSQKRVCSSCWVFPHFRFTCLFLGPSRAQLQVARALRQVASVSRQHPVSIAIDAERPLSSPRQVCSTATHDTLLTMAHLPLHAAQCEA